MAADSEGDRVISRHISAIAACPIGFITAP
jgi:hypothetical protein